MLDQILEKLRALFRGGRGGPKKKGLYRLIIPVVALMVVLSTLLTDTSGAVEVEPGEVAIIYNNTGLGLFGEPNQVRKEQGVIMFMPGFQRVELLDVQPQIFVMSGAKEKGDNHVARLTVRAKDGSNFYFEKVEIHYQVKASMADKVISENGPGNAYKGKAIRTHAREVLRDEFGQYSFLEIADPRMYGQATSKAKQALNDRLNQLGVDVTNIPPPKPRFDNDVEHAIEARQTSEQEVEVQREKRHKLEQEKGRRLQQVEQTKNAEYQQRVNELEASKQQALNRLIASKREADKYFIERQAAGTALRDERVTRAKANEIAYRKSAEGTVARIKAVGEQGPDVLNRTIAEHIFPQLVQLSARPYSQPSTPIDIRHTNRGGGGQ